MAISHGNDNTVLLLCYDIDSLPIRKLDCQSMLGFKWYRFLIFDNIKSNEIATSYHRFIAFLLLLFLIFALLPGLQESPSNMWFSEFGGLKWLTMSFVSTLTDYTWNQQQNYFILLQELWLWTSVRLCKCRPANWKLVGLFFYNMGLFFVTFSLPYLRKVWQSTQMPLTVCFSRYSGDELRPKRIVLFLFFIFSAVWSL